MKLSRWIVPAIVCFMSSLVIVFSVGSQEREAEMSFMDAQVFIEQQMTQGFPIEEAIASALELGIKPELISAVLYAQKTDPVRIAIALVQEGVARDVAASSVLVVSGPVVAPAVRQAVLSNATAAEISAVDTVIAQVVSAQPVTASSKPSTTNTTTQAEGQSDTEEVASSAPVVSSVIPADEQTVPQQPASRAELPDLVLAESPAPVIPESSHLPILLVTPFVTPPTLGGGGGATRN